MRGCCYADLVLAQLWSSEALDICDEEGQPLHHFCGKLARSASVSAPHAQFILAPRMREVPWLACCVRLISDCAVCAQVLARC
jgi:hypothetical protein